MIKERAAPGAGTGQWPAETVQHLSRLMFSGIDFPKLLDAYGVVLSAAVSVQLKTLDQLFAQVPPTPFGKQGIFRQQVHPRLISRFWLTVLIQPHITGTNTPHCTLVRIQDLRCGETGIDFHPQFLRLLRQPAAQHSQADDVIAFVMNNP